MPSRIHGDENFVAMMSNGTSGDINNIPFGITRPPREPFEQIRIVAGKAAVLVEACDSGDDSRGKPAHRRAPARGGPDTPGRTSMTISRRTFVAGAAAGAVTFLSPCVLPLVPGYLSYVAGMSGVDAQASPAAVA